MCFKIIIAAAASDPEANEQRADPILYILYMGRRFKFYL